MATKWLITIAGAFFLLGCGSVEKSLRPQASAARPDPAQQPGDTAASAAKTPAATAAAPATISITPPTQDAPVSAGALVEPAKLAAGSGATLSLRCVTIDPWYIYAVEGPVGVATPTKLELELPAGIRQSGDWSLPPVETKSTPLGEVATYAHDVRFSIPLEIDATLPAGKYAGACIVHYQACSDTSCLPPKSMRLPLSLTVTDPPKK